MNLATNNPKALLEKLEQDARSILMSPKAVTERLSIIGNASFAQRICLRIRYEQEVYLWGDVDNIAQLQNINDDVLIAPGVNYALLGGAQPRKSLDHDLIAGFERLAKTLWGNDIRKHGAITFDRNVVKEQIGESLAELALVGNPNLGVVFIDIDHFKNLNSHITESGADKVIQTINRQFHDMTREFGGLAFNRSGDEFFIFLPFDGLLPVLQALHKMRSAVKTKSYVSTSDGSQIHIDLTMGVALTKEYLTYTEVVHATDVAEALTKVNGEKRRGHITIAGEITSGSEKCKPLQLLKLGAALVRRRLHCPPFGSAYLNFISQQVACAIRDADTSLDQVVKEALAWFDLSMDSQSWESTLLVSSRETVVPRLAVALAVVHGVTRDDSSPSSNVTAAKTVSITYTEDGSRAAVNCDGKLVWGSTEIGDTVFEVLVPIDANILEACLVGVQVGLTEDPMSDTGQRLPVDIFDQIVLVDDRPITGGSLPDFWQPAIAEVFSTLGRHDTEPRVIVWGAAAKNSETYKKLAGKSCWRSDEVARVSKLPASTVETLKKTVSQNIILVGGGESLSDAVFAATPTWPRGHRDSQKASTSEQRQETLTRPMLSPDSLPLEDGVRCRDAAQAYPIIIDVLRKGKRVRISKDDAKGSLKELLAFKLILEDPLRNAVPAYLDELRGDLDVYTQRTMLDKDNGLFRRLFESTKQIEAFIKHLSSYLGAPEPARSTRRAGLVVPNVIDSSGELKPLGLLNVWASPRVGEDRHVIDFVFVWRTVEAFVGLPYSLYGSICLAEDLVKQVALMVPTVPNGRAPAVGELTYMPMSLHMRVDEFHDRIAKRIVDESSD